MAASWSKSLSFTDRLTATTKMQVRSTAYKECHLQCTSSEASKHAKTAEETARKAAASEREYHELIAKAVRDLLAQNAAPQPQPLAPEASLDVSPPTSGATIGRYINAQHHADGLFSEVLKALLPDSARQPNEPTIVALKLTSPSTETAPHDSRREARLLATTAKHPNIGPLLETLQQSGGRLVLAFPFMPHDLATLLHQNSLTESTRRATLRDLFAALAHLHKQDIIHRDIKPSNVLLASPNGPAYLSDFGIAWSPASSTAEPANDKILDVGTTCYRPPELLFGNTQYGVELDLWAAGCTAAQVVCLGGKTLFEAGDLGSELALIRSIFETLGTPGLEVWPEAATFPDWGKMNFRQYPGKPWREILPGSEAEAVDLVSNLVVFESSKRLNAEEVLRHPYLRNQEDLP